MYEKIEKVKIEIEKARDKHLLKFHQKIMDKIEDLVQEETDLNLEQFLDVYNYLKKLNED